MEKNELIQAVTALQKGEQDAAAKLYDAFYQDIYYFILKIVKDPDLASDLTQDTFVEIIETISNLKIPAAFYIWSRKIAYHRCTNYFRKRKELLSDEITEGYYLEDFRTETRTEFLPDETIDTEDLKQTICKMLDSLPDEQRSAILMRYYDEISIHDIATIQKVSEGTVKSRLNYARKSIKESILDYEKKHGVKLHCRGVIPLLLWFFREDRLDKGISLTKMTPFAEAINTVVEKATKAIIKKIVAFFAATLLFTGGVTTASTLGNKEPSKDENILVDSTDSELQDFITEESSENTSSENTSFESEEILSEQTTQSPQEPDSSQETQPTQEPDDSHITQTPQEPENSQATQTTQNSNTSQPPQTPQNPNVSEPTQTPETPETSQPTQTTPTPEVSEPPQTIPVPEDPYIKNLSFSLSADKTYYIVDGLTDENITEIIIPSTYNGLPVKEIADNAFRNKYKLTKATLGDSIVTIGENAFSSTGLKDIILPDSVQYLKNFAFSSCNYLTYVKFSKNLHTIGECAFTCCKSLITITLPKSVQNIGFDAFNSCDSLKTILVENGNSKYYAVGNCIIEQASKTLITGCSQSIIPSDGSVTTIGMLAFFGFNTIESITVPEGITSIEQQAFDFCMNLKEIYLPSSLTSVGSWAFKNSENLTDIYFAGTQEQWNSIPNIIYTVPSTKTLVIHCNDGDITY